MSPSAFNTWLTLSHKPVLVMGILNITPDSFSDGGKYLDPKQGVEQAKRMIDEGADLIDVGGESTRPGAQRIMATEQIRRVVPVITEISKQNIAISIDTTLSEVAAAALDAGAAMLNDISACCEDLCMITLAADRKCPIVIMHMQGNPGTMQANPQYQDVVNEVRNFLLNRALILQSAGVSKEKILLDPGFGFGKAVGHNLALLNRIEELTVLPYPILVGTSRKSFIGKILDLQATEDRIFGTAATTTWAVARGAKIVRVHDVRAMKQVVKITESIITPTNPGVGA